MIVIKETIAIIIVIMETIATKRAMCYTTKNEIEFKQQKIRNLKDLQMSKYNETRSKCTHISYVLDDSEKR